MLNKKYRIVFLSMALILLLPLIACADPNPAGSATETSDVPAASEAESTAAGTETQAETQYTGLGYTVELVKSEYTVSDTDLVVRFCSTGSDEYIVRGEKWRLYKDENGERVMVGQNVTEESIEHKVPKEFTLPLRMLGMSELTEGVYYLQHIQSNVPVCDLRLTVK